MNLWMTIWTYRETIFTDTRSKAKLTAARPAPLPATRKMWVVNRARNFSPLSYVPAFRMETCEGKDHGHFNFSHKKHEPGSERSSNQSIRWQKQGCKCRVSRSQADDSKSETFPENFRTFCEVVLPGFEDSGVLFLPLQLNANRFPGARQIITI